MSAGPLYWLAFVGTFLGVAIWETLQPLQTLYAPTGKRWSNHMALYGISLVLATVVIRLLPAAAALLVRNNSFGLLNRQSLPAAVRCIAAVLLLDFLQYTIHRAYHSSKILWRVHEVHHSDTDYDVSLAVRFHPLEILPSQLIHTVAALLLAPPALAVLASQLLAMLLNLTAHANANFPPPLERALRTVFITPNLHRIHHSASILDHSRNFGQTFSFWDRLFGTYAPQSQESEFRTGVAGLLPAQTTGVVLLLARPFRPQ